MVELTEAFVNALHAGGVHAAAARPASVSPRLKQAAVAVGVEKLDSAPGGLGAYLGVHAGRELYGMRLRATVRMDVLSPAAQGAGACRAALDRVCAVLEAGVAGVSILSLVGHGPEYDPTGDCFAARLEAECRCWLCAEAAQGEEPTLTHFILKGALT